MLSKRYQAILPHPAERYRIRLASGDVEGHMNDKPSDTSPLTISELQGMLQRHAGNAPLKKVIEQALSRRLREEPAMEIDFPPSLLDQVSSKLARQ